MDKWYDSFSFLILSLPVVAAAVLEPAALFVVFSTYGAGFFGYCAFECVKEFWRNGK
jgi:hypothetical protein